MTRTPKKKVRRHATGTSVSVASSKTEIENLLAKHGATQRSITVDDERGIAQVVFRLNDRMVRLALKSEREGVKDVRPRGWYGWSSSRREEWVAAKAEQCDREAWRRLVLVTKARLEVIADDPAEFEKQFLAEIMLPDGSTVYDKMRQQLADTYESGDMPKLLTSGD